MAKKKSHTVDCRNTPENPAYDTTKRVKSPEAHKGDKRYKFFEEGTELIPYALQQALEEYANRTNTKNLDPHKRPYIMLTNLDLKKVKVYIHFMERAEIQRDMGWVRFYIGGQIALTVKENKFQIYYLLGCQIYNVEPDERVMKMLKTRPDMEALVKWGEENGVEIPFYWDI